MCNDYVFYAMHVYSTNIKLDVLERHECSRREY